MQIAVVSDIHGNWNALQATLKEIRRLGIKDIVCLGDCVNPLPASRQVVEFFINSTIPTLRGNHEDYIINAWSDPNHEINHAPQFRPIHFVAQNFSSKHIDAMKALPLTMRIKDDKAGDVFFCHASPGANNKGWKFGISTELERDLKEVNASAIVCGHWHDPQTTPWNSRLLVTTGSTGIPFSGKSEAEFLILDSSEDSWAAEHRTVAYDSEKTVDEYLKSEPFLKGGPIAWLLLCEIKTAVRHVSSYFAWTRERSQKPQTDIEWSISIREFLEEKQTWDVVRPHVEV